MATSPFTPEQEARINDLLVEYLAENGASIDEGINVIELTGDALTDENLKKLTIPSILPNTKQWAYTSLQNMMVPITHAISDLQTKDEQVQETISDAEDATSNANDKATLADTKAGLADAAATGADAAATRASNAAEGAEHVNAGLQGFTVTITDRDGVSRSVDIGFEIYKTYRSVAEMDADAANVPQGKFVVIATTDPTSQDNAKMYCKNSQGTFTFMCDLDQASSAAWADWLENMKPVIQQATTAANNAASNANVAASNANAAASNANTKAAYAGQQGDYAKEWNDHPPYIADGTAEHRGDPYYMYLWDITTHAYVRGAYVKGADLDYSTMTAEEYQRLVENVRDSILFASIDTCEDIVDELT